MKVYSDQSEKVKCLGVTRRGQEKGKITNLPSGEVCPEPSPVVTGLSGKWRQSAEKRVSALSAWASPSGWGEDL